MTTEASQNDKKNYPAGFYLFKINNENTRTMISV